MTGTLVLMPGKKEPSTDFARRLLQLRRARGLTQTQLAEAAGTSQRVISHYETVAEYPAVEVLVSLARVLRVSTDELLGLRAPPRQAAPAAPAPQEKRLWRHLRVVASLPERDQRAVLRLIDTAARATKAS